MVSLGCGLHSVIAFQLKLCFIIKKKLIFVVIVVAVVIIISFLLLARLNVQMCVGYQRRSVRRPSRVFNRVRPSQPDNTHRPLCRYSLWYDERVEQEKGRLLIAAAIFLFILFCFILFSPNPQSVFCYLFTAMQLVQYVNYGANVRFLRILSSDKDKAQALQSSSIQVYQV